MKKSRERDKKSEKKVEIRCKRQIYMDTLVFISFIGVVKALKRTLRKKIIRIRYTCKRLFLT
jgi:hypothetical protein